MRNGKFVLTVNSIKTSRTRAKTWLILLGKQFRSVTQPRDKRDTESRRSADNLASLQTSSHSVHQAITFTSSLTERFDFPQILSESPRYGVSDVPDFKDFPGGTCPRTPLSCHTFGTHKFEPSFAKSWIRPRGSSLFPLEKWAGREGPLASCFEIPR